MWHLPSLGPRRITRPRRRAKRQSSWPSQKMRLHRGCLRTGGVSILFFTGTPLYCGIPPLFGAHNSAQSTVFSRHPFIANTIQSWNWRYRVKGQPPPRRTQLPTQPLLACHIFAYVLPLPEDFSVLLCTIVWSFSVARAASVVWDTSRSSLTLWPYAVCRRGAPSERRAPCALAPMPKCIMIIVSSLVCVVMFMCCVSVVVRVWTKPCCCG